MYGFLLMIIVICVFTGLSCLLGVIVGYFDWQTGDLNSYGSMFWKWWKRWIIGTILSFTILGISICNIPESPCSQRCKESGAISGTYKEINLCECYYKNNIGYINRGIK